MARLPAPVSTAVTAQAAAADAGRKPNTAAREPPPGTSASARVASRTISGKQKASEAAAEANSGKKKPAVPGVSQEAKEKSTVENNRDKVPKKQTVTSSQSRASAVDAAAAPPAAAPPAAASALPVKPPSGGGNATAKKRSKPAVKEEGGKATSSRGVNGMSSTSSGNNRSMASSSRPSDALYTLLGVSRAASSAEIGKAYRALALLLHPDKVLHRVQQQQKQQQEAGEGSPTGKKSSEAVEEEGAGHEPLKEEYIEKMRQEATRHFQELQRAYAVLKDPARRKLYDATGLTGEDGEEPQTFEEAYAFYRKLFPEIDLCAIEKFREEYLGSEAEKDDIREFCEKFNGDLTDFFAYIPFSEKEHLPRYVKILTEFVEKKELPQAKKLTKRAIEQLEQQANKMEKLTAREAAQLQKQKRSSSSEKPSKKRKEADSGGLQALALAIQANANKRATQGNTFLDQLAQKYGGGQGAAGGRKSRGK